MDDAGPTEADDEEKLIGRYAANAEEEEYGQVLLPPGCGTAWHGVQRQHEQACETDAQSAQEQGRKFAQGDFSHNVIGRPEKDHRGDQDVEHGVAGSGADAGRCAGSHATVSSRTVIWRM